MKASVIAKVLPICIAIFAVAGFSLYWNQKLKPIMDAPGSRLVAVPFTSSRVARTRKINLGYASFSIPESIKGNLVVLDASGFVCLGSLSQYLLTFCPPRSSQDAEVAGLLRNVSESVGEPVNSWFALEKLEFEQKPFSVWQLPGMGKRKATGRAALLVMKELQASNTSSVQILENGRIGVMVWRRADFTRLLIADMKSAISQEVLISALVADPDQVISAIASDYELHSKETDIESVKRLIDGAGIRNVGSSSAPKG